MDGPNSRTDETEETISDLEEKIEIFQFEKVEKMEEKWTFVSQFNKSTKPTQSRRWVDHKKDKPIEIHIKMYHTHTSKTKNKSKIL